MHHQRGVVLLQVVAVYWFLLWKGVTSGDPSGYSIRMATNVTVQEGLCVTIPCTFTAYNRTTFTHSTGIWRTLDGNHNVTYSNKSRKGTKPNFHAVGNPDNGDCTLTITDARKGDAASYYFRFDENDTSTKNYNYKNTILTVTVTDLKDNPQIIMNSKLIAGEEANLTCIPPGNCTRAPSNVQWMKSDHNGTWNNSSFVQFIPSKSDHQTNVTCRVTSQTGKNVTSKHIQLNVLYPPSLTVTTAENKTIHRYDNVVGQEPVTLICRADGNPEANVTWYKENNIVNRSKSSSTLHITIMSPTTYACLAWNELGTDIQHLQHVVFLQETTLRDVLIGVACGVTISIITVAILFIFWSRSNEHNNEKKKLGWKLHFNHPEEFHSSQDIPPDDKSQLYAQVQKPRSAAENPHESSNVNDVSYASIKFSKAVAKGTPMQPETEYSEIKFQ